MSAPHGGVAATTPGLRWALLGTMALWGANLPVVKLLLERLEPMAVSALRIGLAALAMLAFVAWQRRPRPPLRARQWGGLALCGAVMIYLNQIFFVEGVARTPAANAALIIALNPLVSALAAAALQGERLTPQRLAGVVLGFGGVASVVLNRPGAALGGSGWGDVLMFGAVLTWVSGGLLVQRLARGIDAMRVSALVNLFGGVLLGADLLLRPGSALPAAASFTPLVLVLLLASGLLSTALGGLVWNRALVTLGVARTSLYAYWVPIFGVLFAVTLLGEPLSVWHGLGLAGVLGGTWLGTRRP